MPNVTFREYNPESGALLGNISVLNFGRVAAGTRSRVKVVDIVFDDVTEVGNIKIGLIASGGLTVNANPGEQAADGSTSNGNFGIESTPVFDSVKASSALSRHFAGLNAMVTAEDDNNISIPSRSSHVSNYIYLDINISASSTSAGNGAYKVFFDYN